MARVSIKGRYRPPTEEPVGRWPRHIDAVRRERGWSQTQGFEAARQALGLGEKSRSAYIRIEKHGPRDPAEEQALASIYGWPPAQEPAPTEPTNDLAAAITRQAAAIESLVEVLRQEHAAPAWRVSGAEEARLRAFLASLPNPGPTAGATPPPDETDDDPPERLTVVRLADATGSEG